jgi:hypothetical protein
VGAISCQRLQHRGDWGGRGGRLLSGLSEGENGRGEARDRRGGVATSWGPGDVSGEAGVQGGVTRQVVVAWRGQPHVHERGPGETRWAHARALLPAVRCHGVSGD